MKKNLDMPNIPMLENAVIAINIDRRHKKEYVLIGEYDSVRRYLQANKKTRTKDGIIYEKTRPFGSFLLDIKPKASLFADIRVSIMNVSKEKRAQNIALVEKMYASDVPVIKYLGLKLWEEYNKILEARKDKNTYYPAMDRIEYLTLPFRHNLIDEILDWQKMTPENPLVDMLYDYFLFPVQTFYVASLQYTMEFAATDFAVMPLLAYYLKSIYDNNKYFNHCKVCGKLFLSPDLNKTQICSEKCRKKQQKKNKQKYDEATRDVDYERTYRNEKMYWYNRIQKAIKRGISDEALAEMQEAYEEFKRVASIMKKQVKEGTLDFGTFDSWYLDMRCVIDDLMEKHGLGKYQ